MAETFNQQNDRENVEKTEVNYDEIDRVFGNLPEVRAGDNVWQNKFHEFDVLKHTRVFVDRVKEITNDPEIIVAGWLHDIGKPVVATPKRDKNSNQLFHKSGKPYHEFTGHEVKGAEMVMALNPKIFEDFDLDQKKIAALVAVHALPMNGIKEIRKTSNMNDFKAQYDILKHKIENSIETTDLAPVSKGEIMSMFLADKLGQGDPEKFVTDQKELFAIRDALLAEGPEEEKILQNIYNIQKEMYGNKE